MLDFIAKVQKLTSGQVQFLNASDQIVGRVSANSTIKRNGNRNGLLIYDTNSNAAHNILISKITHYIIDPAPQVAFSGTLSDFWALLIADFFDTTADILGQTDQILNNSSVAGDTLTDALNNLMSGGGGVVEDNITYVNTPTYSIVNTDFSIFCKVDATVRLPTIGTDIGQVYEIAADDTVKVTVICDTPSGDDIIGLTSVKLNKKESARFKAIEANKWRIY